MENNLRERKKEARQLKKNLFSKRVMNFTRKIGQMKYYFTTSLEIFHSFDQVIPHSHSFLHSSLLSSQFC
jgi:hypothetical protein